MGVTEFENHNTIFSSRNTSIKWLEGPIKRFNEITPHFVDSLKTHHNNVLKLRKLGLWKEVQKEQISGTQIVNQLASLLSEMENLRSQVTETDLIKFDRSINNSKQSAKAAIRSFQDTSSMFKRPDNNEPSHWEEPQDEDVLAAGQEQLTAVADLSEAFKIQERRAASVERLEEDIQDINHMFQELSQMVHEQGEAVEQVEDNVEATHDRVVAGERALARAARYKCGMYPVLGALMGSALGGPVGLFAGLKLGGLAAVAAGALGFTGGKILKNQEEHVISAADCHNEEMKNKT